MLITLLAQTTTPPDTIPYMILGYVLIGGIGLFYVITMLIRQRSLKRDLEIIDAVLNED